METQFVNKSDLKIPIKVENTEYLEISYPFFGKDIEKNKVFEIRDGFYREIYVSKNYCSHSFEKDISKDEIINKVKNQRIIKITEEEFEVEFESFKYTMKFLPEKKEIQYNIIISDYDEIDGNVKELVGTNNLILDSKIYIEAVDVINKAVSGIGNTNRIRTFQPFGIKGKSDNEIPSEEEIVEQIETTNFDVDYWDYYYDLKSNTFDWLNRNTGELLTQFVPSSSLQNYIDDNKYIEKHTFSYNFQEHKRQSKSINEEKKK